MKRRRASPHGMTLLELLCASTLATLLMVAVMGVVAGLAETERSLSRRQPPPEWRRRLVTRLAADLRAADRVEPVAAGFSMTGTLGVDRATGVTDWTRARVVYRVEETPLGPALLRLQTPDRIGAKPQVEVMVQGVTALVTTTPADPETEEIVANVSEASEAIVPEEPYVNDVLQPGDKPVALRLLLLDEQGQPRFDRVIVSR